MPPFGNPKFSFPEPLVIPQGTPPGQIISEAAKTPTVTLEEVPLRLNAVEDTTSAIDLSSAKLKSTGGGNKIITVELSSSSGTFEALSGNKVEVAGSGTGTLQLIGTAAQIKNYLKDAQAIQYTGAPNAFGDVALNIDVIVDGVSSSIGSTTVSIEETPDQQIGTPQDDTLTGDEGRDILLGLESDDLLHGNGGTDTILGGAGNDTIIGGAGADSLDGGADSDVLQYVGSNGGVQIDLNVSASGFQQASGGDAEGDIISNFENVYGTDFGDTIIGDADRNILFGYGGDDYIEGGAGDDVIRGGEGADTMHGGDGIDWLRHVESSAGVTVDLNVSVQVSGGDADGDVISGFENVQGSDFGDVITGDAGANYLLGFSGDDNISGGAGRDTIRGGEGADTLDGGTGIDTLQYIDSASGVTVSLIADAAGFQSASGGDAQGDVISGFENVYGSDADDQLTGNAARNILYGYDGDDVLNGREGADVLRGFAGADDFVFDTAIGATNVDRIIDFETGVDEIMLANSVFSGLSAGALAAGAFHIAAGGVATSAEHRVTYDQNNGNLYYDADGSGNQAAVLFASLTSIPDLDHTDIFVF
jgi:Ca2+-binding RTX toxin-like protein